MNYYIKDNSIDSDIVGGDYPQACKFIKGYNPDSENALFSLYKCRGTFPDYIPNLDGIQMIGSAKLTDFVSNGFSSDFLFVSEKAKSILEKYRLCPHQIYPLGLYKRKKKYDYFLLKIVADNSHPSHLKYSSSESCHTVSTCCCFFNLL